MWDERTETLFVFFPSLFHFLCFSCCSFPILCVCVCADSCSIFRKSKVSSSSFYGKQKKREIERIILMPTTICVTVYHSIYQYRLLRGARIAYTKSEPKSSGESPAASMFQNHFQDGCKASYYCCYCYCFCCCCCSCLLFSVHANRCQRIFGATFSHQNFWMKIE